MDKFKKIVPSLILIIVTGISLSMYLLFVFCGMAGPGYDIGLVCSVLQNLWMFLFYLHITIALVSVIDILLVLFNSKRRILNGYIVSIIICILFLSVVAVYIGIE